MIDWERVAAAAQPIADALEADVLLYNGSIERPYDHQFIELCRARENRRPNVLLCLVTPGGDAHAAYRIARCLQRNYKKFTVFVPGWCKSAGTLLCIGAHELVIGDFGELGPIDVQKGKEDELFESSSGLTEDAALKTLERAAFKMFGDYLYDIKKISKGAVTFKTASEVAAKMAAGLLQPVYAQIDPLKIGENARAMQIAEHYGLRLTLGSFSLKNRQSLDSIVQSYSSHHFVIDRKEAAELFRVVKEPDARMEALCEALEECALFPIQDDEDEAPIVRFISEGTSNAPQQTQPGSAQDDGGYSGGATGAAAANVAAKVAPLRPARDKRES